MDVAALAGDVMPYVSAAVSAYGGAVLAKTQEAAAQSTVGLGTRILRRLFGGADAVGAGPAAIEELAAHPGDADYVAALRLVIRRALEAEPGLAAEIAAMVPAAPSVTASGERSVAVGGTNAGLIITGDEAKVEYPR
ncbi:hypothetical protein [Nonomuraea endophytica]|uniref:Uncharacterized protein n=1 Tax=Nonomuraea endophytica TaxID=714136 RepID=A0A7W8EKE1_9ACTN|nr:hypothetical protein [Nonomuraea endophytica]MBB5081687.1 hypothetical protein [Nonomuraea endophytica]